MGCSSRLRTNATRCTSARSRCSRVQRPATATLYEPVPRMCLASPGTANARASYRWGLIVRLRVGSGWVAAGVSKVTGYAFGIRANGSPAPRPAKVASAKALRPIKTESVGEPAV
jgi:hypothetical protein